MTVNGQGILTYGYCYVKISDMISIGHEKLKDWKKLGEKVKGVQYSQVCQSRLLC